MRLTLIFRVGRETNTSISRGFLADNSPHINVMPLMSSQRCLTDKSLIRLIVERGQLDVFSVASKTRLMLDTVRDQRVSITQRHFLSLDLLEVNPDERSLGRGGERVGQVQIVSTFVLALS